MQLKLLSLIVCFVVFISCKNTTNSNDLVLIDDIVNDDIPSSFLEFHDRFHRDGQFQMSRIIFPLPGNENKTTWLEEDWKLHRPFNNIGNEYRRSYSNFGGIITERIIHESGLFEMKRRFAQVNKEWHLIHYSLKTDDIEIVVDTNDID